jgi:hypothetical protein
MLVLLAELSAVINSSLQTVCRCASVLHCLIKPAEFASSGGFQRVVLSAKCKEETEKVVASCIPFHARKTEESIFHGNYPPIRGGTCLAEV